MAYCTKCGTKLNDDAVFCHKCGAPVDNVKTASSSAREDKLHKCANCGEPLEWGQTECPACGWVVRDVEASKTSDSFTRELRALQQEIGQRSGNKGFFNRLASFWEANDSKVDLIRTFVVPNTKEDLLEFAFVASTNVSDDRKEISQAWFAKLSQVNDKAAMMLPESVERKQIGLLYRRAKREMFLRSDVWSWLCALTLLFGTMIAIAVGLILIGMPWGPFFGFIPVIALLLTYLWNKGTFDKDVLEID